MKAMDLLSARSLNIVKNCLRFLGSRGVAVLSLRHLLHTALDTEDEMTVSVFRHFGIDHAAVRDSLFEYIPPDEGLTVLNMIFDEQTRDCTDDVFCNIHRRYPVPFPGCVEPLDILSGMLAKKHRCAYRIFMEHGISPAAAQEYIILPDCDRQRIYMPVC